MDDAAHVHDDLVLGPDPGDRRRRGRPFVLSQVDPRVDHADPVGRHPFLGDHDLFDRLSQGNDGRGVAQNPFFQRPVRVEDEPAAQAVARDLVTQEGVDLVNHRPAMAPASHVGPRRSTVMLGVNQVERLLAGNSRESQAARPARERNFIDGCSLEFATRGALPRADGLASRP